MSILDRMRRGGISANDSFRITQLGQEKLLQYGGDPKSKLLQGLETNGSGNINDIAQTSGLGRGKVEQILPSLIRGGLVQRITSAIIEESE